MQKPFQEIYQKLNELVQHKTHKKLHDKYAICPIDSTIISLTSKLLWVLGHRSCCILILLPSYNTRRFSERYTTADQMLLDPNLKHLMNI